MWAHPYSESYDKISVEGVNGSKSAQYFWLLMARVTIHQRPQWTAHFCLVFVGWQMWPLSQDAWCVSDMRAVALCRLVTGAGHCGKACRGDPYWRLTEGTQLFGRESCLDLLSHQGVMVNIDKKKLLPHQICLNWHIQNSCKKGELEMSVSYCY